MCSLDSVRKLQIHNESLNSHDNFFHSLFGFITKFSQQKLLNNDFQITLTLYSIHFWRPTEVAK